MAAPGDPRSQLNVRIEPALARRFEKERNRRGMTKLGAVAAALELWITSAENGAQPRR